VLGTGASSQQQPSLPGLIQRMSHDLGTKAVILFHESGQIVYRSGWLDEDNFPSIAALAAAMIAAGKSLGQLGEATDSPTRFSCDSDEIGLYTVAVGAHHWLAALYDQPLNPGQFRMKVRRYAEKFTGFGVYNPDQWEFEERPQGPSSHDDKTRATMPPAVSEKTALLENLTEQDSTLFSNITDDEIDSLFENARS
jgi:predicted regulator of Ras-like GTPase activity (Roadblock/LC7/MglB family)